MEETFDIDPEGHDLIVQAALAAMLQTKHDWERGHVNTGALAPLIKTCLEVAYNQACKDRAELIRNEMVCCDIHQRLAAARRADKRDSFGSSYRALKRSSDYHAICEYGEWAARIVEGGQDGRGGDQGSDGAGQGEGD